MRSPFWTVPNQITFLRLALLPVYLICLFYGRFRWALLLLVTAGLTDALDGLLARRLDQKSEIGTFLDPVADKLLVASSFIVLTLKGAIGWWLTILVLARDVLILVTATVILLVVGFRTFPPSLYGKATTVAQILLVFAVVAAEAFEQPAFTVTKEVLIYVTAALTVLSGLQYTLTIARRLSAH
jgi:cardiolipin synthase